MATDRLGNEIITGDYNVNYNVFEFTDFPQVKSSVSKSETTESVYVSYINEDNGNRITVRFSTHINNAVEFGDQLDGNFATGNEVLYHLGLKKRTFVPNKKPNIIASQIKRALVQNYEMADITIKEMYDLGVGADLSQYTGKVAKNSNWLILGSKVDELIESRQNRLGQSVQIGKYVYHD